MQISPAAEAHDESDEDRKARHLRTLREITDLGLQIARAAAHKTMAALAEEETPEAAEAPQKRPTSQSHAGVFARVASEIRQAMALEIRIVAGQPTPKTRRSRDSRRETLRTVIEYTTESLPNRTQLRTEADTLIEIELLNDPDAETPLTTLLDAIIGELKIPLDCSRMPDKLLESLVPGGFAAAAARPNPDDPDIP